MCVQVRVFRKVSRAALFLAAGYALSACSSAADSAAGGSASGEAGVIGASGAANGGEQTVATGGANATQTGAGGASTAGASATTGGLGSASGGAGGVAGTVAGTGPGGSAGSAGPAGASADPMIHNDTFWKDTSGTPIYSQGGGVLRVQDTYYWYGVKYNGAVSYAASPTGKNSDTSFNAVTCYSSKDLVSWKFEANVMTSAGSGTEVAGASWFGRLGVAYNANTKKYVLVSQYSGTAGTGELFATSSTPIGPFAFDHIQAVVTNVANSTTGD